MANLTITVDEEVLRKARIRALETGTSVNSFLKEALEVFAGARAREQEAVEDLIALSQHARARSGGRSRTRDELDERQA